MFSVKDVQTSPESFSRKGWLLCGVLINGYTREEYTDEQGRKTTVCATPEQLITALAGKTVVPSKSGKSWVVEGEWTAIVPDMARINELRTAGLIGNRSINKVASIDLNALL